MYELFRKFYFKKATWSNIITILQKDSFIIVQLNRNFINDISFKARSSKKRLKVKNRDLHSIDRYLAGRLVCIELFLFDEYFYDAFILDHCSARGNLWGESRIENSVSSRVNLCIWLGIRFVWKTISTKI